MGIKLILLLLQTTGYLWIPELSVRTELLSELSYGVLSDTLTDFFVNPAYSTRIINNRVYCSQQGELYAEPCLRAVALTRFGISGYTKVNMPFSTNELAYSPMDGEIGVACAKEINSKGFGIGYLYGLEKEKYYYGVAVDSEETHSFSIGMISNTQTLVEGNQVNAVINISCSNGKTHYSPEIKKTIINTGVGISGRHNNYFSIAYTSWVDTTSHYNVTIFDRMSALLINNSNTKIYIIGQLDNSYSYKPMYYHNVKLDNRITLRLGVSGERTFDKFSIFGSFLEYIGHSSCTNFIYLSDNPLCIGMSVTTSPLELWVRMSPLIYEYKYWNMELLYRLP